MRMEKYNKKVKIILSILFVSIICIIIGMALSQKSESESTVDPYQNVKAKEIEANKHQRHDIQSVKITDPDDNVYGDFTQRKYVQKAKNYWTKQLGYDVFNHWDIPIAFNQRNENNYNSMNGKYFYASTSNKNSKGEEYSSVFNNKSNTVIFINQKDAERDNVSVSRIIAHELGHALGLNHTDNGLMSAGKNFDNWHVSDNDINRIKYGNWNGILTDKEIQQLRK